MTDEVVEEPLERLLVHLRDHRGFDFTGYKRASLGRRIAKRMAAVGVDSHEAYQDHLEAHPEEFTRLFDTILIKVTRFFRDPEYWDHLANEIVPQILQQRPPGTPIRVWCAGCASGEEAYTLAMILAEAMGVEDFRERVKLYATDLDEGALATARAGTYDCEAIEEAVSTELRDRYFVRDGDRYTFRTDLRRAVIFGRHDLVRDAPISRLDLLVCRNVLMYFQAETQASILANLHFALSEGGFLFLGKAEMLLAHHEDFRPVSLPYRIFRRAVGPGRARGLAPAPRRDVAPDPHPQLDRAGLEAAPWATVVLDHEDRLARANARARQAFDLHETDIGRPLRDLQLSYRPLELRSRVEEVRETRQSLHVTDVQRARDGRTEHLEVRLVPLLEDTTGEWLGLGIAFQDVTQLLELQAELEQSRHELGAANVELQATHEELQSTNEELETTNEELQSTVEELETTNEELQSTNEELETMNEELQSTNAEQADVNTQLAERTEALDQANLFLNSVLASVTVGIVVLDADATVQVWNDHAVELWGLRADEAIGRTIFELDIGLPVEELRPGVDACLRGRDSVEVAPLEARDRRGRPFTCHTTVMPLEDRQGALRGTILLLTQHSEG